MSQPDATGNYIQTGIPIRLQPNASGYCQTNLLVDNYVATNSIFGSFLFRVFTNDSGPTVYFVNGNVACTQISGNQGYPGRLLSTFVTVFTGGGTNASITYNSVTNALGYIPLQSNQVASINGDAIGSGSTNIPVSVTNLTGLGRNLVTNIVNSLLVTATNGAAATTNFVMGNFVANQDGFALRVKLTNSPAITVTNQTVYGVQTVINGPTNATDAVNLSSLQSALSTNSSAVAGSFVQTIGGFSSNQVSVSSRLFPSNIFNLPSLVSGNASSLTLTTTGNGFTNVTPGMDIVIISDSSQYQIADKPDNNTLTLVENLSQNYVSQAATIYPWAQTVYDINGNDGSWFANDGSLRLNQIDYKNHDEAGVVFQARSNSWKINMPYPNYGALNFLNAGVSGQPSPNVMLLDNQNGNNYEAFHMLSNGVVSLRFGLTNAFGIVTNWTSLYVARTAQAVNGPTNAIDLVNLTNEQYALLTNSIAVTNGFLGTVTNIASSLVGVGAFVANNGGIGTNLTLYKTIVTAQTNTANTIIVTNLTVINAPWIANLNGYGNNTTLSNSPAINGTNLVLYDVFGATFGGSSNVMEGGYITLADSANRSLALAPYAQPGGGAAAGGGILRYKSQSQTNSYNSWWTMNCDDTTAAGYGNLTDGYLYFYNPLTGNRFTFQPGGTFTALQIQTTNLLGAVLNQITNIAQSVQGILNPNVVTNTQNNVAIGQSGFTNGVAFAGSEYDIGQSRLAVASQNYLQVTGAFSPLVNSTYITNNAGTYTNFNGLIITNVLGLYQLVPSAGASPAYTNSTLIGQWGSPTGGNLPAPNVQYKWVIPDVVLGGEITATNLDARYNGAIAVATNGFTTLISSSSNTVALYASNLVASSPASVTITNAYKQGSAYTTNSYPNTYKDGSGNLIEGGTEYFQNILTTNGIDTANGQWRYPGAGNAVEIDVNLGRFNTILGVNSLDANGHTLSTTAGTTLNYGTTNLPVSWTQSVAPWQTNGLARMWEVTNSPASPSARSTMTNIAKFFTAGGGFTNIYNAGTLTNVGNIVAYSNVVVMDLDTNEINATTPVDGNAQQLYSIFLGGDNPSYTNSVNGIYITNNQATYPGLWLLFTVNSGVVPGYTNASLIGTNWVSVGAGMATSVNTEYGRTPNTFMEATNGFGIGTTITNGFIKGGTLQGPSGYLAWTNGASWITNSTDNATFWDWQLGEAFNTRGNPQLPMMDFYMTNFTSFPSGDFVFNINDPTIGNTSRPWINLEHHNFALGFSETNQGSFGYSASGGPVFGYVQTNDVGMAAFCDPVFGNFILQGTVDTGGIYGGIVTLASSQTGLPEMQWTGPLGQRSGSIWAGMARPGIGDNWTDYPKSHFPQVLGISPFTFFYGTNALDFGVYSFQLYAMNYDANPGTTNAFPILTITNKSIHLNTTNNFYVDSGTINGNGSGITNISDFIPAFIFTNLLVNTQYRNPSASRPCQVSGVSVGYTEAAVAGFCSAAIYTNGVAMLGGTNAALTALGGLTGSPFNSMVTFTLCPNSTFFFTNISSGAGNSAATSGGQILVY